MKDKRAKVRFFLSACDTSERMQVRWLMSRAVIRAGVDYLGAAGVAGKVGRV